MASWAFALLIVTGLVEAHGQLHPPKYAQPVRVLITGVTGMIGSNIAATLLARTSLGGMPLPPVKLFGMARFRSDMTMLRTLVPDQGALTLLRGDLDDPMSVAHAVRTARPAVVYHFGAQAYNGVSWGAPSLTLHKYSRHTQSSRGIALGELDSTTCPGGSKLCSVRSWHSRF